MPRSLTRSPALPWVRQPVRLCVGRSTYLRPSSVDRLVSHAEKRAGTQTGRQIDRKADRQMDIQTDRQANRQADRQVGVRRYVP